MNRSAHINDFRSTQRAIAVLCRQGEQVKEQTTRMEAQQRQKLALFESQSISLRYDLLRAREQVCLLLDALTYCTSTVHGVHTV